MVHLICPSYAEVNNRTNVGTQNSVSASTSVGVKIYGHKGGLFAPDVWGCQLDHFTKYEIEQTPFFWSIAEKDYGKIN